MTQQQQPQQPRNITCQTSSDSSALETSMSIALKQGQLVGKWRIIRRIGEGGCGVIYKVQRHNEPSALGAMKLEPTSTDKEDEILKLEVQVMNAIISSRGSAQQTIQRAQPDAAAAAAANPSSSTSTINDSNVVELLDLGKAPSYNYIVMQLLGPNLHDLRRACPHQKFTLGTALRVGQQTLRGLRRVHEAGYVHRDVKPSNYAIGIPGQPSARLVYLFDFGLARSWRVPDPTAPDRCKVRPERKSGVAFRGTLRYCSVNVHRRREQGRHDDLWSWLYILVECVTGGLPWNTADPVATMQAKRMAKYDELLPSSSGKSELLGIIKLLKPLTYQSAPPYDSISAQLSQACDSRRIADSQPYDWETGGRHHTAISDNCLAKIDSAEQDEASDPFESNSSSAGR